MRALVVRVHVAGGRIGMDVGGAGVGMPCRVFNNAIGCFLGSGHYRIYEYVLPNALGHEGRQRPSYCLLARRPGSKRWINLPFQDGQWPTQKSLDHLRTGCLSFNYGAARLHVSIFASSCSRWPHMATSMLV